MAPGEALLLEFIWASVMQEGSLLWEELIFPVSKFLDSPETTLCAQSTNQKENKEMAEQEPRRNPNMLPKMELAQFRG